MAKAKAAKTTKKKEPKETNIVDIKLADFIGKRLKDIGHDEENILTIKFENGYNIKITGNISLKKEKE